MKDRKTYIPFTDGTVYDIETHSFRMVTLYELLDRIAECEKYCRWNARMLESAMDYEDDTQIPSCLDSMVYFGEQASICLELINKGLYTEVNPYAV